VLFTRKRATTLEAPPDHGLEPADLDVLVSLVSIASSYRTLRAARWEQGANVSDEDIEHLVQAAISGREHLRDRLLQALAG
jgi:hypothetical protein